MPHSMFCEVRDSHPQWQLLNPRWQTWCVLVPLLQFMKQKHQQQQHSQHHRQTKHITTNTDRHSGSQHSATCTCFWNSSTTGNGCTAINHSSCNLTGSTCTVKNPSNKTESVTTITVWLWPSCLTHLPEQDRQQHVTYHRQ